MLQRYWFVVRFARISYVVICVFILFCVGKDMNLGSRKQKESSQTSVVYGLRAMA